MLYRLGKLCFSIDGKGPVVSHIRKEFKPVEISGSCHRHMKFQFVEDLPSIKGFLNLPPLMIGQSGYRVEHGGYIYHVVCREKCMEVLIKLTPVFRTLKQTITPNWYLRARNWNYLLPEEVMAKNFMYGVFDYLSQIAQLPLGQSYLHCSSLAKDNRGAAFIAWGGVGKTTAMLKLVSEDGWSYLSDDLGLVDDSGILWRSPKQMQIYAYNVAGQRSLYAKLMSNRSVIDRISWAWKRWRRGGKGVRRRVSPERLFGHTSVAQNVPLRYAVFLERSDSNDFCHVSISKEEIANRSSMILLDELKPFALFSTAIYSSGYQPILPTLMQLYQQTKVLLTKALSEAKCYAVRVPLQAGPDELAHCLRKILRLS